MRRPRHVRRVAHQASEIEALSLACAFIPSSRSASPAQRARVRRARDGGLMFAIYWHARTADGTIGLQGHDQAATLIAAQAKLGDATRRAALGSVLRELWIAVVAPDGTVTSKTLEL